ncbi:MAG: hypothetical protein IJB34_08140 [Clostridia bacterium]|nr:hypothetical protein [Clostridia bacterium]
MKRKTQKKLVVFVCTGNTCRSPMAEALFKKRAQELGLKKLKVSSAGTRATAGDSLNEKSATVLAEKGVALKKFASKPVDEKMLVDSLAVVCMTDAQRDFLMDMRWRALRTAGEEDIENNIYSFSELVGYEVIDPYGRDIDCYRYVYELIADGVHTVMDKLVPPSIRDKFIEKPRKPRAPKAENKSTAKKTKSASAGKTAADKNKKRKKPQKEKQL